MIVTTFSGNFVRDSVSSRVDNRALDFVPSCFNTFISFTIGRGFMQ